MLLPLLILTQALDTDEVPIPSRLFARPSCESTRDEVVVCADRAAAWVRRNPPKGDPMTRDRRIRIKISDRVALRLGFTTSLEIQPE